MDLIMSKVARYLVIYSLLYVPGYFLLLIGLDLSSVFVGGAGLTAMLSFHLLVAGLLCLFVRVELVTEHHATPTRISDPSRIRRIIATKRILRFEAPFVWLYFLLACLVPMLGLNNYRHASSFSENMGLLLSLEILRSILMAFIIIKTCDPFGIKYGEGRYLLLGLLVISTIIGSTGSFTVIQVTILAVASILSRSKISGGKLFFIMLMGSVSLSAAVIIGFANKFSFDKDVVYDLFFGDLSYVIAYIGWRITTMMNATAVWLMNFESIPIIQIIMSESSYRLLSVLGVENEPLDIRSMARLNYLEIFVDNSHPRSGTSPGLFGSFASTLPNNLLAFAVLITLTAILLRLFVNYFKSTHGWLPVIIMVAATYQFFDSPLDLLITPHPSQISLFIFVLVIYLPRLKWSSAHNMRMHKNSVVIT